ncbi:MAG: PxxKW family cysteine-rich protein [Desulfobulbaceae bacterium]|jgi:hypothetical protein|nr:PxxKW family cysteine-rich protein [Desulfobulbaceae bacterium]MDY0351633.1 PxxKW family cysteine-rich protein [Desulfobulbaceae bacterium]
MQASATSKYAGQSFQPIVEQCEGCERIVEEEGARFCRSYLNPAAKWRQGMCNFATHAKPELKLVKVRINPLKASKRASRRK